MGPVDDGGCGEYEPKGNAGGLGCQASLGLEVGAVLAALLETLGMAAGSAGPHELIVVLAASTAAAWTNQFVRSAQSQAPSSAFRCG